MIKFVGEDYAFRSSGQGFADNCFVAFQMWM